MRDPGKIGGGEVTNSDTGDGLIKRAFSCVRLLLGYVTWSFYLEIILIFLVICRGDLRLFRIG